MYEIHEGKDWKLTTNVVDLDIQLCYESGLTSETRSNTTKPYNNYITFTTAKPYTLTVLREVEE